MSNIEAVFAVLTENSSDVENVIKQFGGITNFLKAAPSLVRITKTISSHQYPVEAAERASEALPMYYDETTRQHIVDFQIKHHLKPDGIVGPRTWQKVMELLP